MKITNVTTYTTFVINISDEEGNNYTITHREDADGYFVPMWQIEDEDGEEVPHGSLRSDLMLAAFDRIHSNVKQ